LKSHITCIIICFHALAVFGQKDCELKLDKDSIKVYSCKIEGSRFRAVKSTFMLNSRLSSLAAALLDLDHYSDWQRETVSAKLLKTITDKEIIYYTEVAAPVFTSNRDFVIHMTINQNPQTKEMIIDLISVPDYLPAKEKIVRVPYSKAHWTVKSITAGKVLVDYYIEIDLGGAIPPWVVNMVAHQAPYETFSELKKKIGAYKNTKVPFIRD
jgi:hypothetical protein